VKNLSKAKEKKPPRGPGRGGKRQSGGEVGKALRSVYDNTLNEDIPPEMLDLLGKLG
jgi:hypothetical protein